MSPSPHKRKLYCYVDETGQHTDGRLFFVAVIIAGDNREILRRELLQIEEVSGKYGKKWTRATQKERDAYMREILSHSLFTGTLFYSKYPDTRAYVDLTILSAAKVIREYTAKEITGLKSYATSVFVDGLHSRTEEHRFAKGLRQLGISAQKVRGLDDQSDPFIRLADAVAAFVRDSLEDQQNLKILYDRALKEKKLKEV